jgi:hypothetical protein
MPYYVHASNIHTGAMQDYGPFAGEDDCDTGILLTYELLRISGEHIFGFQEQWPDAEWTDQEGRTRHDGWRATCVRWNIPRPPGGEYRARSGHDEYVDDHLWTDLYVKPTDDAPIAWDDWHRWSDTPTGDTSRTMWDQA